MRRNALLGPFVGPPRAAGGRHTPRAACRPAPPLSRRPARGMDGPLLHGTPQGSARPASQPPSPPGPRERPGACVTAAQGAAAGAERTRAGSRRGRGERQRGVCSTWGRPPHAAAPRAARVISTMTSFTPLRSSAGLGGDVQGAGGRRAGGRARLSKVLTLPARGGRPRARPCRPAPRLRRGAPHGARTSNPCAPRRRRLPRRLLNPACRPPTHPPPPCLPPGAPDERQADLHARPALLRRHPQVGAQPVEVQHRRGHRGQPGVMFDHGQDVGLVVGVHVAAHGAGERGDGVGLGGQVIGHLDLRGGGRGWGGRV
jgi:hypothetical protein